MPIVKQELKKTKSFFRYTIVSNLHRFKINKQMKYITLLIFLVTFSLGNYAQKSYSSHDKKAIKYYLKAQESCKLRQSDEALSFLTKALERDNRFMEALLFSADLFSDKGD